MSRIVFSCVSKRNHKHCFVPELFHRGGKEMCWYHSANPPLIRHDMYKQKNKVVQNRKIGVMVVISFRFPTLSSPFPVILAASLPCKSILFYVSFPFPWFSPYAVGSNKDESDKQQHPDCDKDAGYQELGGRVMS